LVIYWFIISSDNGKLNIIKIVSYFLILFNYIDTISSVKGYLISSKYLNYDSELDNYAFTNSSVSFIFEDINIKRLSPSISNSYLINPSLIFLTLNISEPYIF